MLSRSEAGKLGSIKSAIIQREQRRQRREAYEADPGHCKQCNKSLDYEHRHHTFCSQSCSATHSNIKSPKRKPKYSKTIAICAHCGSTYIRGLKKHNACSIKCGFILKRNLQKASWLAGTLEGGTWRGVQPYVREWLQETHGNKCVECGWAKINPKSGRAPLHVDHIDGNPNNHRPDNLRLICPNCHSLTPTFGALNKGKGRTQRYSGK